MGDLISPRFGALPLPAQKPPQKPAQEPEAGQDTGPPMESDRLWRQVWMSCPGIGWKRLQHLEAKLGGLEQAWAASPDQLRRVLGDGRNLGARELDAVLAYRSKVGAAPFSDPITAEQPRRWRQRRQLQPGDPALPESLANLERPPMQLFWRGRGSLWACLRKREAIAVVGTRQPSRHGLQMTRCIGQALAEAGWPVLSGLAEGIDAAAHQGCLEAGGTPIGVLGTPLQRVYPRHHTALQQQVGERGLLISEWAEGSVVKAAHFSLRNRLLVALAQAVVLVECPQSSGAQQSAQLAWRGGLPLWVVPADAARSSAAGSNHWLGRGATALVNPSDLIDALGPGPLRAPERRRVQPEERSLAGREALLLAAIGAGASLEQLCTRLRQQPQQLSERLLQLELAGLISSEPGLWWKPGASAAL